MVFMFLQKSDLLILGTFKYYGYKREFTSIPRRTKRQPFVLGLSAALDCLCCRLFLLIRCSLWTRVIMGMHLPGWRIMSTSNLCDKRYSKSFCVPMCRFVRVFLLRKFRVPFIQLNPNLFYFIPIPHQNNFLLGLQVANTERFALYASFSTTLL